MTFDITGYLRHINMQTDLYMMKMLNELTVNNPDWIKELKKDRTLFNDDGTPVKDVSKEMVDEKIKDIISDADFKVYKNTQDEIYSYFIIDKETVDKFIIEDGSEES